MILREHRTIVDWDFLRLAGAGVGLDYLLLIAQNQSTSAATEVLN
jgi:hypothetical protein